MSIELSLEVGFKKRVALFQQLGFREKALPLLKSYLELLWSANEELNLISRLMTADDLLDNHVIDCLLPLKFFPKNSKVIADFGAGGGLPGIIYALQFPEKKFRLFEKSNRKQDFLKTCASLAPNISVEADIPLELKTVDLVVARGFKPIDVILEVSRSYYQKNGTYFLLKARAEKIEEELTKTQKKFKTLAFKIQPLASPVLTVERHLVLINP